MWEDSERERLSTEPHPSHPTTDRPYYVEYHRLRVYNNESDSSFNLSSTSSDTTTFSYDSTNEDNKLNSEHIAQLFQGSNPNYWPDYGTPFPPAQSNWNTIQTVIFLPLRTPVPEPHQHVPHKVQQPITLLRTNTTHLIFLPTTTTRWTQQPDTTTQTTLHHLTDLDYGLIPLTRRMRLPRPTPY